MLEERFDALPLRSGWPMRMNSTCFTQALDANDAVSIRRCFQHFDGPEQTEAVAGTSLAS